MNDILICTVGGSHQPIIHSIQVLEPDYVVFVCSPGPKGSEKCVNGEGKPCGFQRKYTCPNCETEYTIGDPPEVSIVKQMNLSEEQYEIVLIEEFDDLTSCIKVLSDLAANLEEKHPEAQIHANYTGGTKTMSVALAIVGILTETWKLWLSKGRRTNVVKVTAGDTPVIVPKWYIITRLRKKELRNALQNFDYSAAKNIINQMLKKVSDKEEQNRLRRYHCLCRAFYQWDIFNHDGAYKLLEPYARYFPKHLVKLKKILGKTGNNGYEPVFDLMLNAFRKAHNQHHDDAMARLYRMIELFAQIRISKIFDCKPGKIPINSLPDEIRDEYMDRNVRNDILEIGLREDYILLQKMGDKLGKLYRDQESRILHSLNKRNNSILAHGLNPMQEQEYRKVEKTLTSFVNKGCALIDIEVDELQLPTTEIVENNY